jgi:hypothetical protein
LFIDPAGDDNCGYYTLQLFGIFLLQGEVKEPINEDVRAAIMETQKMRQFVNDYVIEHRDYFLSSEAMLLCQRPDGIEDDVWRDGVTVFQGLHKYDLDLRNQDHNDSLLNCMLSTQKKMDKRHLEVYLQGQQILGLCCCHITSTQIVSLVLTWTGKTFLQKLVLL